MSAPPPHNAMGYIHKGEVFSNLAVDGLTSTNEHVQPNEQFETPLTGETVQINDTSNIVIVDPASTIASASLIMPVRPKDGKVITITVTNEISTLTHTASGTDTLLSAFPSTTAAESTGAWYYRLMDATWYPTAIPVNPSSVAGGGSITGSRIMTARESGTYFITSHDYDFTITLPPPAPGWYFRFVLQLAGGTNKVTVATTGPWFYGTIAMTTPLMLFGDTFIVFTSSAPPGAIIDVSCGTSTRIGVIGASSAVGITGNPP